VLEDELNKEIRTWWYKLPDSLRANLPNFIHKLNKDAEILFVGLNPSGDVKKTTVIGEITDEDILLDVEAVYTHIFGNGPKREGQYKRYFKALSDIAYNLGKEFDHCDLFHMSYRTSSVIAKEICEGNKLKYKHLNHLRVFKRIFDYISPKIVITTSVITANILKDLLDLKLDEESGLYIYKNKTYFYLNGSMSYGRLTEYDKERMILQIKKIL